MARNNAAAYDWVDAQAMARENPGTFEAPTLEELRAIAPGQHVKICNGQERFWVQVACVVTPTSDPRDVMFSGVVDNNLFFESPYDCGDSVDFNGRHVYNIA